MKTLRATALVVFLAAADALAAQPSPPTSANEKLLSSGAESVAALDQVLKQADATPAGTLYVAAASAFRDHRLGDAGFLFYAARFRAAFDHELFPPTGTGGDSPMALFAALQQQLGNVINPAVMDEPRTFAQVLVRLAAWNPRAPAGYQPGWDYAKAGSEAQATAALQKGRQPWMKGMGDMCTLLQDDAYFAAFKTAQDHNLKTGAERPAQAAYDAAIATMADIEQKKGIAGMAGKIHR